MRKSKQLLQKLAAGLDLPADITAGIPRISFNGFSECTLDCHRGIAAFEDTRILVRLNVGTVAIEGEDLDIRCMNRERLTVSGKLHSVCFMEEEKPCGR